MDDLRDIGDLELYIAQSMVINVFLSHGYFKSRNCLREVQATVDTRKPFMITHEIDTSKGGGSLNEMKVELGDTRLCDVIFSKERRITTWYRIADFQLVSIKQIAEFTLLQTPKYKDREKLDIIVPGELLRQPLCFAEPVVVYSSPNKPWRTRAGHRTGEGVSSRHQDHRNAASEPTQHARAWQCQANPLLALP